MPSDHQSRRGAEVMGDHWLLLDGPYDVDQWLDQYADAKHIFEVSKTCSIHLC